MQTTTRNATLADLATMLVQQQARKIEIIAGADNLHFEGGKIIASGLDPILDGDGVTDPNGTYNPTATCDAGFSEKFKVPRLYTRRLRDAGRHDLFDANFNGWLHGNRDLDMPGRESTFLLRTFRGDEPGAEGIARAFLSSRYGIIDNLDALAAALDAVKSIGTEVEITGCDLSDNYMQIRVEAPSIKAYAPNLLKGYRSPFGGSGDDNPVVHAGFLISNSETGGGAFQIKPRFVVQVCKNGMTITKDALRAVHLGGRLEEGVIRWTEETQRQAVQLIKSKTSDAIRTFLDVEYMQAYLDRAEETSSAEVETVDKVEAMVGKLRFSDEHIQGVLSHFVKGGQMTVGGVHNAITAYAQTVPNGDTAAEMEDAASTLLFA